MKSKQENREWGLREFLKSVELLIIGFWVVSLSLWAFPQMIVGRSLLIILLWAVGGLLIAIFFVKQALKQNDERRKQ